MAKERDLRDLTVKISDRSQAQINKVSSVIFREKKSNVRRAGYFLKKKVVEAMSVRTYSLKQLAALGHPYKSAQYPKRINVGAISPLKSFNIHKRSGDLVSGVVFRTRKRKQKIGDSYFIEVFYNGNEPYAQSVFFGSKKMLGRNPFKNVFKDKSVQKKIKQILEA